MSDMFSDITSIALTRGLDGAGVKQKVIANNIANVETPGFIRSDVSFDDQLRRALDSPSRDVEERGLQDASPVLQLDMRNPVGPNGNNVSIDQEMAALTKNSLNYEVMTRLMSMKISMLQTAITEGKK